VIRPALRRGLAENAVARHGVSIALACRTFDVSETCYRYSPLLSDENEEIADLLVGLTAARKTWGFGLCFLHLRNVQGHPWNHKRVYRIYCELELNLRIKPRKRLKLDKPEALAVPDAPNVTWSMDFMADRLGDDHAADCRERAAQVVSDLFDGYLCFKPFGQLATFFEVLVTNRVLFYVEFCHTKAALWGGLVLLIIE
jgi:hypothetical protein